MILGLSEVRLWLQIAAIVALVIAAWRYGSDPERILAGTLAGMMVGDSGYHALLEGRGFMPSPEIIHLGIDLTALAIATAVALVANRFYPLWFAAFQLIALMAHFANEMAPGVARLAYGIMYIGPSYFQIILLAGGIWFHRRRVRRYGPYRSWRTSSLRSRATRPGNWPNA